MVSSYKIREIILNWNLFYKKLIDIHKKIIDLENENLYLKALISQLTDKKEINKEDNKN